MLRFVLGLTVLFTAARSFAVTGDDWHYRDIVQLIEDRNAQGRPFQSPDELIAAFPEGMKRYFTFAFESGNKFQDADPLHPRAIVFNHNLIYAFNGHPSQRGYNVIELMELDKEKRSLELREIEFTKGPAGVQVHYATSTPAKCLQCHGSNPRPIWFQYSTWPGIYGSSDDHLAGAERTNYQKFLAEVRSDPEHNRYAKLKFPAGSELTPYLDDKQHESFSFRLNLVYTKLLTRMNAIRLVGLAQQSPYWKNFKWALSLATRYGGYSGHRCGFSAEQTTQLTERLDSLIRQRKLRLTGGVGEFEKIMAVLDIPVSRYNMAPDGRNYYYGDGSGDQLGLFQDALLAALGEEDPELKKALRITYDRHAYRYSSYDLYEYEDHLVGQANLENCSRLSSLATRELKTELAEPPANGKTFEELLGTAEAVRANPAIPISCVYCHTVVEDANIPRIAFDNEAKLKEELSAENGRLRQRILDRASPHAAANLLMPPPNSELFMKLSDKEYGELTTYLGGLR